MHRFSTPSLAVVSTIAFTQFASAADLPRNSPAFTPAPVLTWTGFYAGLNGGGNWGTSTQSMDVTSLGSFFAPICVPGVNLCDVNIVDVQNAGAQKVDTSGFVVGGQFGYNWQTGNMVFGIETDLQYFRSNGSATKSVACVKGTGCTVTVANDMDTTWLWTVRPRLGWAVNNWLLYATGGLAVSNLKSNWAYSENAFGNTAAGSVSGTKTGWTVGAGVEYMLPGRWVVGAEYLFVKFSDVSGTQPVVLPNGGGAMPQNFFHSADLDSNIVRARLSKLF